MKTMLRLLAGAILFPALCFGAYSPKELCVIPWGDGASELKIDGPSTRYNNYPPRDSGEEYMNSVGPDVVFIDRFENIYIGSSYFKQLKCFNNHGKLQFDYSKGQPAYNPDFFQDSLGQIYVDSLRRLFILDGRNGYVPVIDKDGKVMEKIIPPGIDSGMTIYSMVVNSEDKLTLYYSRYQSASYSNGKLTIGGSMGQLGKDDFYYYADYEYNAGVINFFKTEKQIDFNYCQRGNRVSFYYDEDIQYAKSLGVDEDLWTFILCYNDYAQPNRILIFDGCYFLIGQIYISHTANRFEWSMEPFMRPSDGNIYEFRVLDDGLHLVRWSRMNP